MLLWHSCPSNAVMACKFFLVTDAIRACLYIVMAIFSAVRPWLLMWWHFSMLSLGHVAYHSWYVISVHVVRRCFLRLASCY